MMQLKSKNKHKCVVYQKNKKIKLIAAKETEIYYIFSRNVINVAGSWTFQSKLYCKGPASLCCCLISKRSKAAYYILYIIICYF